MRKSNMITIDAAQRDWIFLRQALALSLAAGTPLRLPGAGEIVSRHGRLRPLVDDCIGAAAEAGAGDIAMDGDSLVCAPRRPGPVSAAVSTGRYSSIAEIALLLLPSLLMNDFRSAITLTGVSHSHLSHPTAYFKESLFHLLERMGLFCSLTLRRFGFYGSGGGLCEVRAYPREKEPAREIIFNGAASVDRAQILSSGMSRESTEREKDLVAGIIGVPSDRISIIDIIDADGPGNSVQVYGRCGDFPVVFSADAVFYNENGDYVFDEEDFRGELMMTLDAVKRFLSGAVPPVHLMREAALFGIACGYASPLLYDGYEDLSAPLSAIL